MSSVLDKAILLVNLVASGRGSLSDLVQDSDLSRSTAHRLLSTLVEHGYLSHDQRRYELGYRLLELGEKKRRSLRFLDTIRPVLERCSIETLDTIHVAVMSERDIVLIDRVAGHRHLQLRSYVGQRTPAYSAAVGKALISRMPQYKWSAYLQNVPLTYAKTAAEIRGELGQARETGFAYDLDECSVGTCGVASTFRVNEGLMAAVSINGATVYFQDGRLIEMGGTVRKLARQVNEALQNASIATPSSFAELSHQL